MTADGLGADGLAHGGGVYLEQPGNTTLQDEVLDVCIHLAAMRANSYPGTDRVDLMGGKNIHPLTSTLTNQEHTISWCLMDCGFL